MRRWLTILSRPRREWLSFDVRLEMLGEIVDAFREDRHLHFRRTGIARLLGEFLDDFSLAAGGNRHRSSFLVAPALPYQAGQVEHALGDDFATVEFGKGEQLARDRNIDRAAENWVRPVRATKRLGLCASLAASARLTASAGMSSSAVSTGMSASARLALAGSGSMAQSLQFFQQNHAFRAKRANGCPPQRADMAEAAQSAAHIAGERAHVGAFAAFGFKDRVIRRPESRPAPAGRFRPGAAVVRPARRRGRDRRRARPRS